MKKDLWISVCSKEAGYNDHASLEYLKRDCLVIARKTLMTSPENGLKPERNGLGP